MEQNSKTTNINFFPGIMTGLTFIFVIAKIWGKIDWSWWWVLSPIWISAIIAVFILIIVLIVIWVTE